MADNGSPGSVRTKLVRTEVFFPPSGKRSVSTQRTCPSEAMTKHAIIGPT